MKEVIPMIMKSTFGESQRRMFPFIFRNNRITKVGVEARVKVRVRIKIRSLT